jgi:DNA-binding CsgD family transcriptional regulator/energy-coupling factor transporter ATP-binding protein EcfA2
MVPYATMEPNDGSPVSSVTGFARGFPDFAATAMVYVGTGGSTPVKAHANVGRNGGPRVTSGGVDRSAGGKPRATEGDLDWISPVVTIGDVIAQTEAQFFVGRTRELRLFQEWLSDAEPQPEILNVYGPRGIGKSTLVRAFGRTARTRGRGVRFLDGRRFRDPPDGPRQALHAEAGRATDRERAPLIVIDNLEEISSLTDYLLTDFLPTLPREARVVVCSSRHLDAAWAPHDAWLRLVRSMAVPPLSAGESDVYLRQRGLAERALRDAICQASGGHPLALSLAANLALQRGVRDFPLAPEWQMTIGTLLEHVLTEVTDPALRAIVRRCAAADRLDEHLLGSLTGPEEAAAAFDQLSRLSFVQPTEHGLALHTTIRRFLMADTQWRGSREPPLVRGPFEARERSGATAAPRPLVGAPAPGKPVRRARWTPAAAMPARDKELLQHLTRRERELAVLLARGRTTNREIARELVISDGTANLHVKHMLNKLGFANRAKLAAWLAQWDDLIRDVQAS